MHESQKFQSNLEMEFIDSNVNSQDMLDKFQIQWTEQQQNNAKNEKVGSHVLSDFKS